MYTQLFDNLTTNDVVLTVNRRLTAYLRERYAQHQLQSQQVYWPTPQIMPLTSWLEHCWEESLAHNSEELQLLTNFQEQFLWQQIIETNIDNPLFQLSGTVKKAQQAWQLCQQWQIDFTNARFDQNENSQPWKQWAKEFQTLCQQQQWLDLSRLPDWLLQHYFPNNSQLPQRIYLVGFDELNPQYQRLVKQLRVQNITVEIINQQIKPQLNKIALTDPKTELETMARWAHQLWQQGKTNIGCVVPNLSDMRTEVIHAFNEIFCPQLFLAHYHDQSPPFNISAGQALKDFPLINTALQILQLQEFCEYNQISHLIHSPYIGHADTEYAVRARLDQQLASGEPYLSLKQVIVSAKKIGAQHLAQQLQNFLALHQTLSKEKFTAREWAIHFSRLLTTLGWPGERPLYSKEYQLIESWSSVLTHFAQLSQVSSTWNVQQALQQLMQLVANQVFQPQSTPKPIQILGILEAAGLEFDQLWIMGLHDNTWPSAANPNPFIPLSLQQQLQLPHSSSQRELEYCRQITQRLFHSAKQVIVSYPQTEEDRSLRPSPLINDLNSITNDELNISQHELFANIIFAAREIELLTDDVAPQLNAEEITTLKGGASLLKDQAACPFRAFARFRLGAISLKTPAVGLNYQERGSLLHHSLEIVWNKIGNQHNLISLTEIELTTIIQDAISAALVHFVKQRPFTLRQRYIQIEKKRLSILLKNWLELEKTRAPFTVVSIEKTIEYNLAGIPLKLRSDRIDQLANNRYFIIDYKTGNQIDTDWFSDRPKEPQLPLYCITSDLAIDGVALAQVRSDKKLFRGISANDDSGIPGVHSLQRSSDHLQRWEDLVIHWQQILQTIGQQFYEGHALVDPADGHKTCQFCDLKILCRIS